jgi:hypothetical protein
MIPGVLFLGKTYGRQNGCYLYKFKPNDRSRPVSYVPHKIHEVGFSKVFYDLYVLVTDSQISQILGATNNLDAYCAYQLHCDGLILTPMHELTSAEMQSLRNIAAEVSCEDRTSRAVFTIDGPNTEDYDDAFSICGNILSIYISDVYHILEAANLWETLSERVSNIYLDVRTTMLCGGLVEICSLKANKTSLALAMDYDMSIGVATFSTVRVRPYRNYIYSEPELASDDNYQRVAAAAHSLRAQSSDSDDSDSDDSYKEPSFVVEQLMRLMCFKVGAELHRRGVGIFRTLNVPLEECLPSNKYILSEEVTQEPYAHVTSPMRRLVDVLNAAALFACENSPSATEFYNRWVGQLDVLNAASKAIRRIQNEYALLNRYDSIKDGSHNGVILSSETYEKEGIYYYTVFLEDIRLLGRLQLTEHLQGRHMFKVFKFDREANFRKKIRLGLM